MYLKQFLSFRISKNFHIGFNFSLVGPKLKIRDNISCKKDSWVYPISASNWCSSQPQKMEEEEEGHMYL